MRLILPAAGWAREAGRHEPAREHADQPDAVYHARVVIEVLSEAVSGGEIQKVLAQLPEDYFTLFESGSIGALR